jgi:hypothetical protein
VLREQPANVYEFSASYLEELVRKRGQWIFHFCLLAKTQIWFCERLIDWLTTFPRPNHFCGKKKVTSLFLVRVNSFTSPWHERRWKDHQKTTAKPKFKGKWLNFCFCLTFFFVFFLFKENILLRNYEICCFRRTDISSVCRDENLFKS